MVLHAGTMVLHAYGVQSDTAPPHAPVPVQKPPAVYVVPTHVGVQLCVVGSCSHVPAAVQLPSLPHVPLLEHWPLGAGPAGT